MYLLQGPNVPLSSMAFVTSSIICCTLEEFEANLGHHMTTVTSRQVVKWHKITVKM